MRTPIPVAVVVLLVLPGCVELEEESPLQARALSYLESVQAPDGGFSVEGNASASDFSTSAWVAIALGSAAPDHPAVPGLRAFLANQSASVRENATGSFSRTNAVSLFVLASVAIDVPGREEHVARLREQASNTSLAANEQMFLVGALSRAGERSAAKPVGDRLMAKILDPDDPDVSSDAWMRAYAILAVMSLDEEGYKEDLRAAARSLLPFQKDDKGFRSSLEYEPDASTTAAVVAVLSQIRFVYSHEHETGLEFLLELQESSGNVRFSDEFDFSPVKTTAEAILATTGDGPFRA